MNQPYLFSLLATTVEMTTCLLCARQIWRLRHVSWDSSRRKLFIGAIMSGLLCIMPLMLNMAFHVAEQTPTLLKPWIGLIFMAMHIVMTLYPISVVKPDWLTSRRAFFIFLPWAIFVVLSLYFIGRWTPLDTFDAVWKNLDKPDVLVRLCSQLAMLPYCIIILDLPYNYRRSSASRRWIVSYAVGLTVVCLVHNALMLTNSPALYIILPLLAATFYMFSTEYELEDRIMPHDNIPDSAADSGSEPTEVLGNLDLWSRICNIMDKEELWRDPDFTLGALAQQCASNPTYITREIQEKTGSGFKDLVNAKRVEYVAAQLMENRDMDIQTAFFNAGYRSRATAWRNFKEKMGVTPTDFRQTTS